MKASIGAAKVFGLARLNHRVAAHYGIQLFY
jgi:hypothetical protein